MSITLPDTRALLRLTRHLDRARKLAPIGGLTVDRGSGSRRMVGHGKDDGAYSNRAE